MSTGDRGREAADMFHREAQEDDSVVARLRQGLADAGLDCGCRDRAFALLDRIGEEGERASREAALVEARKMRDAILVVIALLGEVDELTVDEPDRTAFREVASLFQDLSDFAAHGAEAARHAAGRHITGH